ncbi:MAG: hypothetical protein FJ253_08195 [Phycisphaerae bacterium]|nr:hypothetical protein [Phycisphaerae bacterium]
MRIREVAGALAMLAIAAVLGACTAPTPTPRESRDAGVEWLVRNQNPDGSFGRFQSARVGEIYLDNLSSHRAFHVATSALCAWALVEPARSDPTAAATLDRALDWLAAAPLTARASGSTFYDVWAHTYLIELAAAVLADARLASRHDAFRTLAMREVLFSRQEQAADGGWGYYDFGAAFLNPTGNMSTSFNTAAMILALRAIERQGVEIPPAMIRDGIVSLKTARLPNGAFTYDTAPTPAPSATFNMVRGSSGRLQVCNLALHDEGEGVDTAQLRRGLEFLRDHHHYLEIGRGRPIPHEAYYQNSGYYYYFGHYYASQVALRLERDPTNEALTRWLAEALIRDQFRDGSWFDYPLYGYGHAYATGYAVLSMSSLIPLLEPRATASASP